MAKNKKKRANKTGAAETAEAPAAEQDSEPEKGAAFIFGATVFLSAFLLFQVQPMICKAILHWFGGTPAVWTTSMFFFQIVLLIGYCYAHWTTTRLSLVWQMLLHVGLIIIGLLLLPIEPSEDWKPVGGEANPTWRLLGLLTRTVGVQFLLLSTTAPLVQVWWHRRFANAPYRLYAISNAGSLVALLSYPFLVEPNIGVASQLVVWSVGFLVVAGCLALCTYRNSQLHIEKERALESDSAVPSPSRWRVTVWVALSTCGSVLLLAMTNHIAQNVAVVPFLWIAPLALYLLTFILAFGATNYYRRGLFGGMMLVSQTAAAFFFTFDAFDNIVVLLLVHLIALFSGCMVCHGELARAKPHAQHLTIYFVMISVGGALGGFLVSIMAPLLFSAYYEYPLVLLTCWGLLFSIAFRDPTSYLHRGRPIWAWGLVALVCFGFLSFLRNGVVKGASTSYLAKRNFYGVLSVQPFLDDEGGKQLQLMHGMISHGSQHLDGERQSEPTSYYRRDSGVGYVMGMVAAKPKKRIGMLGLGVGTLAAYSEPGDYFRAYEINQQVIDIATDSDVFTFWSLLPKRGANGDIVIGDARISLENELKRGDLQEFDVLVLDVFSGDAIPVHLLTVQAFETYFKHVATHGMIAVHISNRHLDLLPIVNSTAQRFSADVAFIGSPMSEWLVLGSPAAIRLLVQENPEKVKLLARPRDPEIWTDDYSDILGVLK